MLRQISSSVLSWTYLVLVYAFIFLPVAVLVLFSLQATSFPIPPFTGPSLRWYGAVLSDARLTSALGNSLLVAVLSSLAATVLGYAIWGFLLRRYPAAAVTPFALLVPFVAALGSALVFGERFGALRLTGMALVLAGLAVIVLPTGFATADRRAGSP